ncbi:hypothetical protein HELRODRAFT_185536 [Helobdella robusta]|uniref:Calcineurin-like phosphoesterase domain-containing protein n=1 Tax=Helobdella robusta TaxID=6412 RepID=T1FMY0_HELRO|nr:hypothetical protein HELRODRAFT_185536 [Helobdella robusta]ESO04966.1 hypothetical protein HELRODRAFT_185536 [Helobdella robusta]
MKCLPKYSLRGFSKWTVFIIILTAIIPLYNEIISFDLASLQWTHLNTTDQKTLKILFVADPQIVGLVNEHWLLGYITRWDCDRYIKNGFSRALEHVKPDVIIFLGDLFDEGSRATDTQYATYVERFSNIFVDPYLIRRIYIPGDNDVGGEGFDFLENWKLQRFHRHFPCLNDPVVRIGDFVDVIRMNNYKDRLDQGVLDLNEINKKSTNNIKMFISHLGVIDYYYYMKDKIEKISPNIIVAGHEHHSSYLKCQKCLTKNSVETSYSFDENHNILKDKLRGKSTVYQITVPTCSYRMGTAKAGYGYMAIDGNSRMQYTVLWLPQRYPQLFLYLGYLLLLLLAVSVRKCCSARVKLYSIRC